MDADSLALSEFMDKMVRDHEQDITVYAYSMAKNYDDAKELVQISFVHTFTFLQDNPDYQITDIRRWLQQIVRNQFLNMTRYNEKFQECRLDPETGEDLLLALPDPSDKSQPENVLEREEEAKEVREKIKLASSHPDTQRAMAMHILDGVTYRDISRIYRIPISTIKSRVNKGMDILKDTMIKTKQNGGKNL